MSQDSIETDEFKPSYVWPNAAFPFRVYLDHPKCRIFIIENIGHNWMWMKEYSQYFRASDFFFVYCGWYYSEHFAIECEKIFDLLQLRKENFFFMFNSPRELLNFEPYGFTGEVINHNAWLNEGSCFNHRPVQKVYDAVYVARLVPFKRHHLASAIPRLALVAGDSYSSIEVNPPPHVYINDKPLPPEEVSNKINEAHCGLILSASEGACFSSSEYLLCGTPVVSTASTGGRDVWYNDYNSIICRDTPDEIASAVERLKATPRNPERIRMMHIDQQNSYRRVFIRVLDSVFRRFRVELNASQFFVENYIHKLRGSMQPDFKKLFAGPTVHCIPTTDPEPVIPREPSSDRQQETDPCSENHTSTLCSGVQNLSTPETRIVNSSSMKGVNMIDSSFQSFNSLNALAFNREAEARIFSSPSIAVFPSLMIKNYGQSIFDTVLKRIYTGDKSPLCEIMSRHGSDKATSHNYTQMYYEILKNYTSDPLIVVEVGIGTINQDVQSSMPTTYFPGSSLRGWREFFNSSETMIYGGDVDPRSLFATDGIKTGYLNSLSPASVLHFFKSLDITTEGVDLFIDDGLHESRSNISLLISVWPFLKPNGIYIIEDMHKDFFDKNIDFLSRISLGAHAIALSLESNKEDNRMLVLQKISSVN